MCGTCGCGSESKGPTILKPGEENCSDYSFFNVRIEHWI